MPLPYESNQIQPRPDICIGTDAFHTPPPVRDTAVSTTRDLGWSVAVDRPFAGAIVPLSHYRRDSRVASVMVEVNRQLYMDESTGGRLAAFVGVRDRLHQLINALAASI